MKRFLMACMFCAMLLPTSVLATHGPHIVTSLSVSNPAKNDDGMVSVSIKNDGDEDAYVISTQLPITYEKGRLGNDLFEVADSDFNKANYLGVIVELRPKASAFRRIAPGETINYDVNLLKNYRVEPGISTVVMKPIRFEHKPLSENDLPSWMESDPSKPLEVWFTTGTPPLSTFIPSIRPLAETSCPNDFPFPV